MLFKSSANSGIYSEFKPINSQTKNGRIKFVVFKLPVV